MICKSFCILLIVVILIPDFIYCQFVAEGERCILQNGKIGVCINLLKCEKALNEVKKGFYPFICSFNGKSPNVCCELEGFGRTRFKPTKPGQVSDLKCKEYAHKDLRMVSSIIGNETIYQEECLLSKNLKPKIRQKNKIPKNTKPDIVENDWDYVIGGVNAEIGQYPHTVAIGYGEEPNVQYHCAGSLISENWILTAAHCNSAPSLGPATYILVGFVAFSQSYTFPFKIIERIRHPNYTRNSYYNDIMLMKVVFLPPISYRIRPACLRTDPIVREKTCIAAGWGVTDWRTKTRSDVLQTVFLDIYNSSICNKIYDQNFNLNKGVDPESQICVGALDGGRDTCNGDSGGGILLNNQNEECMFDILGVTSIGSKFCGTINSAGLYTRVYHYLDWIERIVWPEYFN